MMPPVHKSVQKHYSIVLITHLHLLDTLYVTLRGLGYIKLMFKQKSPLTKRKRADYKLLILCLKYISPTHPAADNFIQVIGIYTFLRHGVTVTDGDGIVL